MTEQELKAYLTEWVKDYCNNKFLNEDEEEELPGGVEVFLDRAVEYFKSQSGINSESLGDYSVSFDTDIPESLLKLLRPYRKVKFS